MTLSQILNKLVIHFDTLMLDKALSKALRQKVHHYVLNNSEQWTVDRLKSLKSDLIHVIAGGKPTSTWISYRGKLPRDPVWRQVFKLGLSSRKGSGIALSILNSYKIFATPNREKLASVLNNISKPISSDIISYISDSWWYRTQLPNQEMEKYIRIMVNGLETLKDGLSLSSGLNTKKPFVSGRNWFNSMNHTARKVLPTESLHDQFFPSKGTFEEEPYGGELIPLYEGGNKVRIIALPHAELQMFLHPLHRIMNRILESIPEDCTHDQDKGMRFGRDSLRRGATLHSVDLSAATDRFPLKFQMACLRKLIPGAFENYASHFERTSKLLWKGPLGDVTYGAGQPMGLYGSFAIFSYSHHLLVRTLCYDNNIPRDTDGLLPYRILGDDILIANDRLSALYKAEISKLGVEVSVSKTITSNLIGEFAGYIIDRKGGYKPPKPSINGLKIDNLVNYLKILKVNPFESSHYFHEVTDLLLFLPSPIGVGMNPSGRKYLERLNEWRDTLLDEEFKPVKIKRIHPQLIVKHFEIRNEWNPYTREIVSKGIDSSLLDRLAVLADKSLQEISDIPLLLDLKGQGRDDMVQQMAKLSDYKPLLFEGALGLDRGGDFVTSKIKHLRRIYKYFPWDYSSPELQD